MSDKRTKKGFTIIELLVSIGIFSILITAVVGIFVGTIKSQRDVITNGRLIGEARYVFEIITRVAILAKEDEDKSCLTKSGKTYQFSNNEFRFIDYKNQCNIYYLEDGSIYKKLGNVDQKITSPEFIVNSFNIEIFDDKHDRVLIFLNISSEGVEVETQTSLSKRSLQ